MGTGTATAAPVGPVTTGIVSGPGPAAHTLRAVIYDLQTSESLDITSIALTKKRKRDLNLSRQFVIGLPARHPDVTDVFGDGFAAIETGDRKLLVWQDDEIIHHGRIFEKEITGGDTDNQLLITSYDPVMELGYESDGRAGRPVRDETGNFVTPSFNDDGPISGPDLIYQILTNSMQTGTESDPNPGEGPLPITLTGTFDTTIGPAIDLSPSDSATWPMLVGDFIQMLLKTGVFDIDLRPVDPAEAFDPYVMGELSAVNLLGSDKSGTVHFDFWTGSRNAIACRYSETFATQCDKLYDYLGPRVNLNRWAGNITPGSPGATVDPTAARARYHNGGANMFIRERDSLGTENSVRKLWIADWNMEAFIRLGPRKLLFITPNPDTKALFEPAVDYDCGDLIAINTGAEFGIEFSDAMQRVYGYDQEWDVNGVSQVSQLRTSADQEAA